MPALGAAAVLVLFAVLFISGGAIGEGARQLWAGKLPPAASIAAAAGGIAVQPGDTIMRRNQDLPISAQVLGNAGNVQAACALRERRRVGNRADGSQTPTGSYDFTLYAVREGAQYYVTAGRLKSAEHQIQVVDLPSVEKLRLTYDYPGWTGLAQRVEEGGADIRAVAGTEVGLEVVTSAPLEGPLLVIDGNGQELTQSGLTSTRQARR